MKKLGFKSAVMRFLAAAAAVCTLASTAVTAYAEDTSDVTLDTSKAVTIGDWGTSVNYQYDVFDSTRMTADSVIEVEYTLSDGADISTTPIELVFQSWESPDTSAADASGNVWAKVQPSEYSETSAKFLYNDIVAAYGTDNFEKVSCINFTATAAGEITVTKVTVTSCIKTGSHYVDKTEEKQQNKKNMTFIVVGIIGGIVIAVVVILLIMNKKSSSAYDVSSRRFVDKKKVVTKTDDFDDNF